MNLEIVRQQGFPADLLLTGGNDILDILIGHGQKPQTLNGEASKWSHIMMIVDTDTVAESTIDFKPYRTTGKRLDNGAQYNYLDNHKGCDYGMLLHFPFTIDQRAALIAEADRLIKIGYRYPISGLVGCLLCYWALDHIGLGQYNPLQSRRALYCSAFIQMIYKVVEIDFDAKHSERNTSPEMISQYNMPGLVKWKV